MTLRVSARELNRLLQRGHRRANRLEPTLRRDVRALIDAAAAEAAGRFARHATPLALTADLTAPIDPAAVEPVEWFAHHALTAAAPSSLSCMVAVYPAPDEAAALALPGGEESGILHCTLAFLGEVDDETLDRVIGLMAEVALEHVPRVGKVGGIGTFGVERDFDAAVLYPSICMPDTPGLAELRHAVCAKLDEAGIDFSREHDFNPHITLAYTEEPSPPPASVLGLPLTFGFLTVARGDVPVNLGLTGPPALRAGAVVYDGDDETALAVAEVAERCEKYADPDYGDTYWHAADGKVFWVSADYTTNDGAAVAEQEFLAVDGVNAFESCAECGAPEGDGWELIFATNAGGNSDALNAGADSFACPFGDPTCPCPDGLACHYQASGNTPAWPAPADRAHRGRVVAAGEPPPEPGWVKPSPGQVLDVDALVAAIKARIDPVRLAVIEKMMSGPLEKVGLSFETTNPLVGRLLSKTGQHIVDIARTTQADVVRVIDGAYRAGLSIPHTASLIQEAMRGASDFRATNIARTEMAGVVNGGAQAAVQIVSSVTGEGYAKVWLTAPGAEHPRHEEYDGLDGQTVPLDGLFDVGGVELEFPGDPSGPPEEICQCRCTCEYVEEAAAEGADLLAASGRATV